MQKSSGFWAPILVLLLAAGATLGVALSNSNEADNTTQLATENAAEAPEQASEDDTDTGSAVEAVRTELGVGFTEATGPAWLVPWGEGFLEIGLTYPEPTLPANMRDDFPGLFPDEVLDLFVQGEEVTVSEAQERLTEAGLFETVEAILAANPDALEAITNNQAPPTLHATTSSDGSTWEPLELNAPVALEYISSVSSDGTHLVLATNSFDPETPQSAVATTDDLETWNVYDIAPATPTEELPDVVRFESSLQQVLVTDNGWLATQMSHTYFDIEALVGLDPATAQGGWGWSTSPTGLTLELDPAGEPIFDEDGNITGEEPSLSDEVETREYTWEELGIDPATAEMFTDGPPETASVWAATWGHEPVQSPLPMVGWVQGGGATNDTFFLPMNSETEPSSALLRSNDGATWSEVPLPSGSSVESITGIKGGLLARVHGNDGLDTLVSHDDGGSWHEVVIPGLPNADAGGFAEPSSTSVGFAVIVDAQLPGPEADIEPGPVTYQHDGFEITTHWTEAGWSLTIIDLEAGETVLEEFQASPTEDEVRAAEEAGELERLWVEPAWVSYDNDSVTTYLDPETGEVIVEVPHEVEGRAHEEAWRADMEAAGLDPDLGFEWVPDLYLVGTRDGERWLVEHLPIDDEPWPALATINGNKIVVNIRGQRTLFELS